MDPECGLILGTVDKSRSISTVDTNILFVRVASLDGAVQIYISDVYRLVILHIWHYLALAGHPAEMHM